LVNSELIPLWYKTILEYQRCTAVNDTLIESLSKLEITNNHLISQNINLTQRNESLIDIMNTYEELTLLKDIKIAGLEGTLKNSKKTTKLLIAGIAFVTFLSIFT